MAAGQQSLSKGRSSLDLATLTSAKRAFDECAQGAPQDPDCRFDIALTELYLRKASQIKGDAAGASRWLDAAIVDAQKAVELNDKSADAHALLADAYGDKITGMLSGMHYGPKANAEIDKAMHLDPNNARVHEVIGRKSLYAPSAFGGDVNKSIDEFTTAVKLEPGACEPLVWLAIAYRKKGDAQRSQQMLAEALKLDPGSVFAARVKAGIE